MNVKTGPWFHETKQKRKKIYFLWYVITNVSSLNIRNELMGRIKFCLIIMVFYHISKQVETLCKSCCTQSSSPKTTLRLKIWYYDHRSVKTSIANIVEPFPEVQRFERKVLWALWRCAGENEKPHIVIPDWINYNTSFYMDQSLYTNEYIR